MADFGIGDASRSSCYIIREVYENDNSLAVFEVELEHALIARISTIVIEPAKLGEETERWIRVGNFLHKTAVVTGMATLAINAVAPRPLLSLPFGFISLSCVTIYAISWQFDPCCKYQVEYNLNNLSQLPLHELSTPSPVVLVRRDDSRRKWLHNLIGLAAGAWCFYRIYNCWGSD